MSVELLNEAEQLAKVADSMSAAYARELQRVLRDLERELTTLLLDAKAGSKTALSRAVRAGKLRRQIRLALTEAGYPVLVDVATSQGLDRLILQIERLRGAAKLAAFTTSDYTRFEALKQLANLDLLGQGDEISHALWRTLAQGLFSLRPVKDILEDLAEAIDEELAQAMTLYDTAIGIFGRQVEALKSTGEPDEVFAYVGPLDRKTRPFCFKRVGKVYTRTDIDAMDNKQLPNVFMTGGGYNCRHVWQAVSKVSELRDLVGTDQRMPEVEQRLSELELGDKKAA